MNVEDWRARIKKNLIDGCLKNIAFLKENHDGELFYSFVIHCASGFVSFGTSAASRAHVSSKMEEQGLDAEEYMSVYAAEWHLVNFNWEAFSATDELVDSFFHAYWDVDEDEEESELDDDAWLPRFFCEIIISVFEDLKASKVFEHSVFEDDLLLGAQVSDPEDETVDTLIQISEKVNSPQWHALLEDVYRNQL